MIEIFVSTDVETDGPIPGPHSMLSFGSAAFTEDKTIVSTFEANLETLPGASGHPDTMKWWNQSRNQEAWKKCRVNLQDPKTALLAYVQWLKALPGRPVFVGYPAGFDFLFIYWYLIYFTGESPFSFSALDTKSFAAGALGVPYREATKKNLPKAFFDAYPHTHVALDDALEQGAMFINILQHRSKHRLVLK